MTSCLVCLMKHQAILYDKDCMQASSRCLSCGWMTFGCWFGMLVASPRLPTCKRTDESIPWWWLPWRMWDTPGLRCLWLAGLPSKSPAVSSCAEPLPPRHSVLNNTSANRCCKWIPCRRRYIFLSFSFDSFLCGFTIIFMQTATEWTFVNHWQRLSTHSTMSRYSNEVTSLLLFLSVFSQPLYTLVNLCQPCPRDGKIKALKILRGRNALQR